MNEYYARFLDKAVVVSESEFISKIVENIPIENISEVFLNFDYDMIGNLDSVAGAYLDAFIQTNVNKFAYTDEVNTDLLTFYINSIDSLEELNKIEKLLPKWTIINKQDCEDSFLKEKAITILDELSNAELKKFVNNYAK